MRSTSTAILCLHNIIKESRYLESNGRNVLLSKDLLSVMMLCTREIAVDGHTISKRGLA